MTQAVAIIHVYPELTFDERDPSDIREIVGVILSEPDETEKNFKQRVSEVKDRLSNQTWRIKPGVDVEKMGHWVSAEMLDSKVYDSGYLETETIDIL